MSCGVSYKNYPFQVIPLDYIFIFSSSLQVRKEKASCLFRCCRKCINRLSFRTWKHITQKCWKNPKMLEKWFENLFNLSSFMDFKKIGFESSKCTLLTCLWKCLRLVLVSFKCCRNVEVPVIWNFNFFFWFIKLIWSRIWRETRQVKTCFKIFPLRAKRVGR